MNRLKQLLKCSGFLRWQSNQLPRFAATPISGQETLGSRYGGWTIPVNLLDETAVCYCFGAGEDISFDIELLKRFGCHIHTFDPTPRAKQHVEQLVKNTQEGQLMRVNNDPNLLYDVSSEHLDKFRFHEFGVWKENTSMMFYTPRNPEHVSHSILNLQKTADGFVAQCYTPQRIMKMLKHDYLTLVKLDIEGAEYAVLESLLEAKIKPQILCVEFDEGNNPQDNDYLHRISISLETLLEWGYQITYRDGWDFTLVDKAHIARH